jgi:hypothetical protein
MEKERGVILDEIARTLTSPKKLYRMILRNCFLKAIPLVTIFWAAPKVLGAKQNDIKRFYRPIQYRTNDFRVLAITILTS